MCVDVQARNGQHGPRTTCVYIHVAFCDETVRVCMPHMYAYVSPLCNKIYVCAFYTICCCSVKIVINCWF